VVCSERVSFSRDSKWQLRLPLEVIGQKIVMTPICLEGTDVLLCIYTAAIGYIPNIIRKLVGE
jgi:hypothetical protein